jgi:hypothetical protein
MTGETMNQLVMQWIPVTGPDGRVRMESVWHGPLEPLAPAAVAVVTHAA